LVYEIQSIKMHGETVKLVKAVITLTAKLQCPMQNKTHRNLRINQFKFLHFNKF